MATSIAIQRRDEIIRMVADGVRLADIIRTLGLGVSPQAVSQALQHDAEYKSAREYALERALDRREDEMERAAESIDVARARELLAQARWRAERECPHRWGGRGVNIQINQGLISEQALTDVASGLLERISPTLADASGGMAQDDGDRQLGEG